MSALAIAQHVMETLFDPDGDELAGIERTLPDAARGRSARPAGAPAEKSPAQHTPAQHTPEGRAPAGQAPAQPAPADPGPSGAARSSRRLVGGSAGGPMLDELIAGLWEGLAAHRAVECPVCGSGMRPEYAARALPIGGRCGACGSTLT